MTDGSSGGKVRRPIARSCSARREDRPGRWSDRSKVANRVGRIDPGIGGHFIANQRLGQIEGAGRDPREFNAKAQARIEQEIRSVRAAKHAD